jgi:hypothetical protein
VHFPPQKAGSGGPVLSVTLRDPSAAAPTGNTMDIQPIKNEMAALRERFDALRGYL